MNSSDIHLAGELSRRLINREPADSSCLPPDYLRFHTDRPAAAEPEMLSTPPVPAEIPEIRTWDEMLNWALRLAPAESGFVVDAHGFVVAAAGELPDDEFEGLGAELCYTMEQLDRIDGRGHRLDAVMLEFPDRNISTFRIQAGGEELVLGLLSQTWLKFSAKQQILQALARHLDQLR